MEKINRGKEKKNGREGKEKKEGGGARQRRPRLRSATRGVRAAGGGARGRRREEKGEREKEGAGFAAAGHDASRWMGKRWDAH